MYTLQLNHLPKTTPWQPPLPNPCSVCLCSLSPMIRSSTATACTVRLGVLSMVSCMYFLYRSLSICALRPCMKELTNIICTGNLPGYRNSNKPHLLFTYHSLCFTSPFSFPLPGFLFNFSTTLLYLIYLLLYHFASFMEWFLYFIHTLLLMTNQWESRKWKYAECITRSARYVCAYNALF